MFGTSAGTKNPGRCREAALAGRRPLVGVPNGRFSASCYKLQRERKLLTIPTGGRLTSSLFTKREVECRIQV